MKLEGQSGWKPGVGGGCRGDSLETEFLGERKRVAWMCCEYTVGKCPPQERGVLCTGNAQAWGRSEPGQGYTDGSALGDVTTLQVSMPSFKIFVMRVYIS